MATPPFSNPTNQGPTWTWTSGPRKFLEQILFHPPDCGCLTLIPLFSQFSSDCKFWNKKVKTRFICSYTIHPTKVGWIIFVTLSISSWRSGINCLYNVLIQLWYELRWTYTCKNNLICDSRLKPFLTILFSPSFPSISADQLCSIIFFSYLNFSIKPTHNAQKTFPRKQQHAVVSY